jgi:hypothetical protein
MSTPKLPNTVEAALRRILLRSSGSIFTLLLQETCQPQATLRNGEEIRFADIMTLVRYGGAAIGKATSLNGRCKMQM